MKKYILTHISKKGDALRTEVSGSFAEGMADQNFHASKASGRYSFIQLLCDGAVRAQHVDTGEAAEVKVS